MMRSIFIILLTTFFSSSSFATGQIPDKIIYNGKTYELWHSNPMESYFKKYPNTKPQTEMTSTALWRGYVATFEIKGKQLFLKDIELRTEGKREEIGYYGLRWKSVVNEIFLNQKLKIDWMTGIFILPIGKIIKEAQRYGDYPTRENYILLEIDKGHLMKEKQFNYKEYEEFKKEQFDAFKKTDEYEKIRTNLKKKGWSNESIDSLVQYQIIEYSSKILIE